MNYRSFGVYAESPTLAPSAWVLYDPEPWDYTPLIEQQHPKSYIDAFCQVAASRGQQVIASPVRGLTGVPGADCRILGSAEGVTAAYLRCQIPAACSRASILDVQAQPLQTDTAAYQALVQGAREQRPGQTLWTGLTTLRSYPLASLVDCYEAVAGIVDGFWLNSSAPTIQTAIQFLTAIGGAA